VCELVYSQTFLTDQLEEPPFFDSKGQGALDIKSYAVAVLGKDFTEIHRDNYHQELYDNSKHSHKAVEDAREYS
jgi:xanthine dehydrogenase molybdopterin-binding subunit B